MCRTAEIVCGKWTLLVIRDLAEGRSRFCELERSLAGISPRTLSLRLRALEEEGIVERQTFPEVPPRVEYVLTDKGRALVPLIEDMRAYGAEWLGARLRRRARGRRGLTDAARRPRSPRADSPALSGSASRGPQQDRAGRRRNRRRAQWTPPSPARDCSPSRPAAGSRPSPRPGAEMPFEVVEERGGAASLYCYRPLTGEFIRERPRRWPRWPATPAAARAGRLRGARRLSPGARRTPDPADPRAGPRRALAAFLEPVFAERSEFGFEPAHFESAYAELERALYEGHCTATVIAPVLGVALDPETSELTLGDGLSLIRGDALADAPSEAVWGDGEEPHVLARAARSTRSAPSACRCRWPARASGASSPRCGCSSAAATRSARWPGRGPRPAAGAPWRSAPAAAALADAGPAAQEDELRAFYDLVTRRLPGGGELAWALARFEMGCERLAPFEALTDYLLALRALLEPEGPASGRLAQRLAVICAPARGSRRPWPSAPRRRSPLERAVITGLAAPAPASTASSTSWPSTCGRSCATRCAATCADLGGVADDLLAEAADAPAAALSRLRTPPASLR